MRVSGQSSEDQNGDRNPDSKGLVREVSGGNKGITDSWTGDYKLLENVFPFCLCPKTLWETEIKSKKLMNLVEEIQNSMIFR